MPNTIYKIYLITNTINGKQYVGFTKFSLEQRWRAHVSVTPAKCHFHKAIKCYGQENFRKETIYCSYDSHHIKMLERFFIREYDTYKNGYNSTMGGEGMYGIKRSKEFCEAVRLRMIGNIRPIEARKKQSETMLGVKKTKLHALNISKGTAGVKKSKEHSDKINKNPEKIRKTAEKHKGMKRSDENKRNMSVAAIKRISREGGIHNKGKKWIVNRVLKIRKFIDIDELIPEGFEYGHKF